MKERDDYFEEGPCGCAESRWLMTRARVRGMLLGAFRDLSIRGVAATSDNTRLEQETELELKSGLDPMRRVQPTTAKARRPIYWRGSVTDLVTDLRAALQPREFSQLAEMLNPLRVGVCGSSSTQSSSTHGSGGAGASFNPMHLMGDPASFDELIDRSSLGSPDAKELRAQVPKAVVDKVLKRVDEIGVSRMEPPIKPYDSETNCTIHGQSWPCPHCPPEPAEGGALNVTAEALARVKVWIERTARRLRHDGCDTAELRIFAHQPGWDDDETCMIDLRFEERCSPAEISGRVEGVK